MMPSDSLSIDAATRIIRVERGVIFSIQHILSSTGSCHRRPREPETTASSHDLAKIFRGFLRITRDPRSLISKLRQSQRGTGIGFRQPPAAFSNRIQFLSATFCLNLPCERLFLPKNSLSNASLRSSCCNSK